MLYALAYVVVAAITACLLKYTTMGDYFRPNGKPDAEGDTQSDPDYFLAGASVIFWPFVYFGYFVFCIGKIIVALSTWVASAPKKTVKSGISLEK